MSQSSVLRPASSSPVYSSQGLMSSGALGGDVPRSPRLTSGPSSPRINSTGPMSSVSTSSAPVNVNLVLPEGGDVDCGCGPERTSKPLTLQNFMGRVDDTRAEEELMKHGYAIVDKVFTKDDSGKVVCEYIKARTVRGQLVFVEMDSGGCVAYRKDDLTAVRTKDAIKVPHSAKIGALECADLSVCGVAFECNDGICTLVRKCDDRSLEPSEHHLVTVSKHQKKAIVMDDNPIAYPVIKMSEIMANNCLVMENIDKVTKKMRKKAFLRCKKNLHENKCLLRKLMHEYHKFCENTGELFATLERSIYELECLQNPYLDCPPECEGNKEKYKSLGYNLRVRHDYLDCLIHHCDEVTANRMALEAMHHQLHDKNCWFEKDCPDFRYVLPPCEDEC